MKKREFVLWGEVANRQVALEESINFNANQIVLTFRKVKHLQSYVKWRQQKSVVLTVE